jgi:O-acetyl-ADP-ribose deacetylase (regulator of RNase III)
MKFTEVEGNLFDYEKEMPLAHCIAADYRLGAGIAVEFVKRYDMRNKLMAIGKHVYPDVIKIDNTYNIVTKEFSSGKPIYENFTTAMNFLAAECVKNGESKLAFPLLGCGIDGLDWHVVTAIIRGAFADTRMELIAVHFKP